MNEDLFTAKGDSIKLKFIRNDMGLSVEEFSQKTEINPSFLNLLEKGYLPLSTRDKRKISEAFGLQENWFELIDTSKYQQFTSLNTEEENKSKDECQTSFQKEKEIPKRNLSINSGEALKIIRTAVGLSRKEIAEAIGITSVQIGYIETGKRTLTDKVKNKLNEYFRKNSMLMNDILIKDEEIIKQLFNNSEDCPNSNNCSLTDEEILNKVKLIKKARGYTQAAISDKSGVNRSQYSLIENGKLPLGRRIKVKLLDFIASEEELLNSISENNLSGQATVLNTSVNALVSGQKNIKKIFTEDLISNKSELISVINSMKKTRDELIIDIKMLEKVLKYM